MKKVFKNMYKIATAKRVIILNEKTDRIIGVYNYTWYGKLCSSSRIPDHDEPSLYKVIFKDQSSWYKTKMVLSHPNLYGTFSVKVSVAKDHNGNPIFLCKTDLDGSSLDYFAKDFSFFSKKYPKWKDEF